MAEELTPDFASKLKELLTGSKKEMKELYALSQLYNKALGDATDEATKYNRLLGSQQGMVTGIVNQAKLYRDEQGNIIARTQKQLALAKILNDVESSINDLAEARNRAQADLLLKQEMVKNNLTGEFAEQAKNVALLLQTGEITESVYKQHIKQLQQQQLQHKELQEQVDLYEEIAARQLEIIEDAESWKKSFTKIFETAKAIARDPKVLGAFLFTKGIEALEKFTEGFQEFKEMGLTAGQAVNAQFKSMDVTSMDWWLGLSDTRGVMQGIVEEYGNVNALSKETVSELGKMAHHFGISGQEALKLNAALSQMPGETSKTAKNAMEHVGHMAELEGIAPGKIMKDMADQTETMALYSAKGAEGFGKAAIELHKMGVEIGTAAKLAEGLLNFEDSINKQMEASVLLGREINLDKARELSLTGDLEGATREVLQNVGGAAEFDKMNVLQKKALAEAAGLTVAELQKTIDAQEESNKYFGEGTTLGERALGTIIQYGSAAAGFLKENGVLLLSATQFILNGNLAKMAGYAKDTAFWAAEKAHMLWKWGMQKLMGKGGSVTEAAKDTAQTAVPKDAGKSTGGLTKAIQKINPAKLLAGAAALVIVAGAVFVFAKAAQEFMSVSWGAIGKAVVAMLALVGALALVGTIMMSGVGAVAILAGAGAMLIMSAALFVLGKAIQEMAKGFELFTPSLLQLAPMAMDIVILGAGLSLMGAGMIALGLASWIAAPGLMLAAVGLGMMVPSVAVLNNLAQAGMLGSLGESFMIMASAAPGLLLVAGALMGIGAGLGLMALAGFAALPVLATLIELAAVASVLTGLGTALGGLFGGGEGEKEDKMDTLIAEIRELKVIASQGGQVSMDGKKVGEVIRLGLNSAGIR